MAVRALLAAVIAAAWLGPAASQLEVVNSTNGEHGAPPERQPRPGWFHAAVTRISPARSPPAHSSGTTPRAVGASFKSPKFWKVPSALASAPIRDAVLVYDNGELRVACVGNGGRANAAQLHNFR